MKDGNFTKTDRHGYARAPKILNTKCTHDFQWSIRLCDSHWFHVGVATRLPKKHIHIGRYDKNSILLNTRDGVIFIGENATENILPRANVGDAIHCRFRPKLKKFCISLVRLNSFEVSSNKLCSITLNPEFRIIKKLLSISKIKLIIFRLSKARDLRLFLPMLICS